MNQTKPNSTVIAATAAIGLVSVLACINGVVKSFAGTPAPAPVAPVSVVAAPPVNPLGGWVARGLREDNKDIWYCSDPESGETHQCEDLSEFKGKTKAEARKTLDSWKEAKLEGHAQERAREEYGKNTYGNCGWTGCRGL